MILDFSFRLHSRRNYGAWRKIALPLLKNQYFECLLWWAFPVSPPHSVPNPTTCQPLGAPVSRILSNAVYSEPINPGTRPTADQHPPEWWLSQMNINPFCHCVDGKSFRSIFMVFKQPKSLLKHKFISLKVYDVRDFSYMYLTLGSPWQVQLQIRKGILP